MKLAGIDGVIVDWYGLQDFRDYPCSIAIPSNWSSRSSGSDEVCDLLRRPDDSRSGRGWPGADSGASQTRGAGNRVDRPELVLEDDYVQLDRRPVLLSFGQTGLTDAEWTACLKSVRQPVSYFSLHHRRQAAIGAFDWPIPQQGVAAVEKFSKESHNWPQSIPVAFPRFADIYSEAKVGPAMGESTTATARRFASCLTVR